jgi:hypothetical protein
MTNQELALLKSAALLLHHRRALEALAKVIRTHPEGQKALERWAAEYRAQAQSQTFPAMDSASSDMWAAISAEALNDTLSSVGL